MRPAPSVDKEDIIMKTDNTVSVVAIEYFNMKYGRMVTSHITLEEYESLAVKYEEDAAFWKKHGIETANDFIRLILSRQ